MGCLGRKRLEICHLHCIFQATDNGNYMNQIQPSNYNRFLLLFAPSTDSIVALVIIALS